MGSALLHFLEMDPQPVTVGSPLAHVPHAGDRPPSVRASGGGWVLAARALGRTPGHRGRIQACRCSSRRSHRPCPVCRVCARLATATTLCSALNGSHRATPPRLRDEPASGSPEDNVTPVTAFVMPERAKRGAGFPWEDGRPVAPASLCPPRSPVFTPQINV